SPEQIGGFFMALGAAVFKGYSLTLLAFDILLIPFFFFYLSRDLKKVHAFFLSYVPRNRIAEVRQVAHEVLDHIYAFVKGQVAVSTILGAMYAIGLWTIGLNSGAIIGLITGMLNVVPYLGVLTGLVLATGVSLVSVGDYSHVLAVWTVFAIVQTTEA